MPFDDNDMGRTWQALLGKVRRQGVDWHTAEDVVQEVWLRTLQRHPDKTHVPAWLVAVARRMVSEQRRSERGRRRRERDSAVPDVVHPSEVSEESTILRLVQELRDPFAEILRLRFLEDCETEEVARRLGYSPATIRSYTKRGLEQLRLRVEGQDEEHSRSRLGALLACFRGLLAPRRWALWGIGAAAFVLLWSIARASRESHASVARSLTELAQPASPRTASDPLPAREALDSLAGSASLEAPEPTRIRLAGLVLSPEGFPEAGANVYASVKGQDSRTVAKTDSSGRYEFVEIEPEASVWAGKEGWWSSREVYVASIPDPGAFDLVLTRIVGKGTLQVLSSEGQPIAGAEIEVLLDHEPPVLEARCSRPAPQSGATLSASGALEVASRRVKGYTDSFGTGNLFWPVMRAHALVSAPGFASWEGMIEAPGKGNRFEIRLARPLTLEGRIRDSNGRPASNALVEAFHLAVREPMTTHCDADGRFQLEGLPPGAFVLRAAVDPGSGADSIRHEGELVEGQTLELDLELSSSYTIRGRVIQVPGRPRGSKVQLVLPDRDGPDRGDVPNQTFDAHGRFQFAGCSPGSEHRITLLSQEGIRLQERLVRPGPEEVILTPEIETDVLAPLVLEFEVVGATPRPTLVEVRSLHTQELLRQGGSATRFSSGPLPLDEYEAVAWCPPLGSYSVTAIAHDPRSPETHRLVIPVPGHLSVQLRTPPDVDPGLLWVGTRTEGPSRRTTMSAYDGTLLREFGRDPARQAFEAELFPGEHWVLVRGPGIADHAELVSIESGEETVLALAPSRGVRVNLAIETVRSLRIRETAFLEVEAPRRPCRMPLPLRVRWAGRQEFLLNLPADVRRLSASTSEGLSATLDLSDGPLDSASEAPSLLLRLESK